MTTKQRIDGTDRLPVGDWVRSARAQGGSASDWFYCQRADRLGRFEIALPQRRLLIRDTHGGFFHRVALEPQQMPRRGGRRWVVLCPCCGAARRDLVVLPRKLVVGCRSCCGLAYQTQLMNPAERVARRARRLTAHYADTTLTTPFPPRPRGRWRALHRRRSEERDRLLREVTAAKAPGSAAPSPEGALRELFAHIDDEYRRLVLVVMERTAIESETGVVDGDLGRLILLAADLLTERVKLRQLVGDLP